MVWEETDGRTGGSEGGGGVPGIRKMVKGRVNVCEKGVVSG